MAKIDYIKLIVSIIICQMAGIIGSVFTITGTGSWYTTINKPFFNPPGWVFGPVWTLLYLLMGISLYLIWQSKSKLKGKALSFFGIQLILNTLWSILFFGLQSPLFAFIEILFLWFFIAVSISFFYRIKKITAYLLIPYILWVSFAAILNLTIVFLN